MGIAELIALGTLAVTICGGVWGSFNALTIHLSKLRAELAIQSWRLTRIESDIGRIRIEE